MRAAGAAMRGSNFHSAFERVDDPASKPFEELFGLYKAAIPPSGHKPHAVLASMCRSSDYAFHLARRNGAAAGFAIVYEGEVRLLEYLAVHADLRGMGIGSALFARARARSKASPLLIEVETGDTDRDASPMPFYRKLGCRRFAGLDYICPIGASPPPMVLMIDRWLSHSAPKSFVEDWLMRIYRCVYGCEATDGRLVSMCRSLPDEVLLA